MGEIDLLHLAQRLHPLLGNVAVTEHRPQDTGRRSGIAVGIGAAARRDFECAIHVARAIEQPHDHIGRVDGSLDVERVFHPLRTGDLVAPFLFDELPRGFPVGILLRPADRVRDALVIGTLGRNRFQGFGDDIFDVVRDERQRIHGRHVDAAVPAVAVGHDVADAVAHFGGGIGHTGRHESREVGFDLEIEVVGVRIILPVPAFGRFHSVENIVTRRLIGMPQLVGGIGEGTGHRVDGHVESVLVVNLDEGQIHVDVVVQAGLVVVPPFDIVVGPRDLVLVGNDRPVVLEFGRAPVGAAESLSGPTALDLVQQHFSGQRYGIGRRAAATGHQQHDGRQRRKH